MSDEKKGIIAYYEDGYALIARLLSGAGPLERYPLSLGATERIPEHTLAFNKDTLDRIVKALLTHETLSKEDIDRILAQEENSSSTEQALGR